MWLSGGHTLRGPFLTLNPLHLQELSRHADAYFRTCFLAGMGRGGGLSAHAKKGGQVASS